MCTCSGHTRWGGRVVVTAAAHGTQHEPAAQRWAQRWWCCCWCAGEGANRACEQLDQVASLDDAERVPCLARCADGHRAFDQVKLAGEAMLLEQHRNLRPRVAQILLAVRREEHGEGRLLGERPGHFLLAKRLHLPLVHGVVLPGLVEVLELACGPLGRSLSGDLLVRLPRPCRRALDTRRKGWAGQGSCAAEGWGCSCAVATMLVVATPDCLTPVRCFERAHSASQ